MKRIWLFIVTILIVFGFAFQSLASLIITGTDSIGNRLIYDSDLNITWYDYTSSQVTFQEQINWVNSLTVNINEQNISGWGLPKTVDGTWSYDLYN